MSLATKTKKVQGIISLANINDTATYAESLKKYLSEECEQYAFILHNLDVREDGEYKTPHFHFVADFKSAKRLSTILHAISESVKVNDLAVTLEKYVSFEGSLQYLVHKNDPDKVHYKIVDIVHNIPQSDFDIYMHADTSKNEFDRVYEVVASSRSRSEIMRSLGLKAYTQYHRVIDDLIGELWRR